MLLIAFCGKFYSFYKLFMPKLFSQSKHEEFESNSALQIRDQKERRAKNAKKLKLQENFRKLHCSSCEISPVALFMSPALFIILLFDVLTHFVPFLVFFQICPL